MPSPHQFTQTLLLIVNLTFLWFFVEQLSIDTIVNAFHGTSLLGTGSIVFLATGLVLVLQNILATITTITNPESILAESKTVIGRRTIYVIFCFACFALLQKTYLAFLYI